MPLWCPYSALGFPLFAEGQSGAAYFPNWIFYLTIPFVPAYNISLLVHLFITALSFFALMRILASTKVAALTGAIGWAFSSYFIRKLMFVNMIQSMTLIPLMLYLFIKMLKYPKKKVWIIAGMILALQILAGHPQAVVISLVLYLLFVFCCPIECPGVRRFALLTKTILLGAGLSAWQWIPTLRLMLVSCRNPESGFTGTAQMSFSPAFFPSLFIPDPFGNAAKGTFIGSWNAYEWEISAYVGIVIVLLACLAPLKNQWVRFFWGIIIFGILMALGGYTPFYSLLSNLPLFNSMRIPSRWLVFIPLAFSALATISLSGITSNTKDLRRKVTNRYWFVVFPISLVVLVGFGSLLSYSLYNNEPFLIWKPVLFSLVLTFALGLLISLSIMKINMKIVSVGILCLVVFDLWQANAHYPGFANADIVMKPPEILETLNKTMTNDYRILSLMHEQVIEWDWHQKWTDEDNSDYKYFTQSLPMYSGMIFNTEIITFNEWSPLHYSRYKMIPNVLNKELIKRMGIKYILAPKHPLPFAYPQISQADHWKLLKNEDVLPKAHIVRGVPINNSPGSVVRLLRSPQYISAEIAFLQSNKEQLRVDCNTEGIAEIVSYRPHKLIIDAHLKTAGTLVVTDAMDSGWIGFVDGDQSSICTVDSIFRGLQLSSGQHEVVMKYNPVDYKFGLFISGISLVIFAINLLKKSTRFPVQHTRCHAYASTKIILLLSVAVISIIYGIISNPEIWKMTFNNWF